MGLVCIPLKDFQMGQTTETPRIGLLGPGRRRNGLGPFLAAWFEKAGARIVAAAGRDLGRTQADCEPLAQELGHAVVACADQNALLARDDLDVLLIASPPMSHLEALEAALGRGLAVYCEKPIVLPEQAGRVPGLVQGFLDAGLLLVENCQNPQVLPVFEELFPELAPLASLRPRAIGMGLSPAEPGIEMVQDSLSHFLSVVQALVPVDRDTVVRQVQFSASGPDVRSTVLSCVFEGAFGSVLGQFELKVVPSQPRPYWLSIDGQRIDRKIRASDYAISYVCPQGREVPIRDPLDRHVHDFVDLLRIPDLERTRTAAINIRERARLFEAILQAW